MTSTTRLDNLVHADLKLAAGFGPAFGDAVNQMPVVVPEYEQAQRDYPLLFQRQPDGLLQAFAILGLDHDENLFLDEDRWVGGYIPAIARKGPFLIGFADGEPVIHVDLDHARVRRADGARSEPVFLAHGGHAPALDRATAALRTLHLGHEIAAPATALFDELALVEPVSLSVQVTETHMYRFSDYLAIQPDRVAALDATALARLNAAGLLMPAIFAAGSLGAMERLAARKLAKHG